jgi:hypothetical protein
MAELSTPYHRAGMMAFREVAALLLAQHANYVVYRFRVDWRARPDILSAFRSELRKFGHEYRPFTKSNEAAADGDQDIPTGKPGAKGICHKLAA